MRGLSHYSFFSFARLILISMVALLIGGTVYLTQAVGREPASSGDAVLIPKDSIRIRIIAQSDSKEDQAIKLAVRDRVADLIVSWGEMPSTLTDARDFIEARLPEVRTVTDKALRDEKAPYGAKIELAEVPFPEKTFEGKTYPADDYEALRITLGEGEGANWWCVLFPPLCLTAATAKDDASAATVSDTSKKAEAKPSKAEKIENAKSGNAKAGNGTEKLADAPASLEKTEKPHAKFFILVLLEKLIAFLSSLF